VKPELAVESALKPIVRDGLFRQLSTLDCFGLGLRALIEKCATEWSVLMNETATFAKPMAGSQCGSGWDQWRDRKCSVSGDQRGASKRSQMFFGPGKWLGTGRNQASQVGGNQRRRLITAQQSALGASTLRSNQPEFSSASVFHKFYCSPMVLRRNPQENAYQDERHHNGTSHETQTVSSRGPFPKKTKKADNASEEKTDSKPPNGYRNDVVVGNWWRICDANQAERDCKTSYQPNKLRSEKLHRFVFSSPGDMSTLWAAWADLGLQVNCYCASFEGSW
jgi:hypothetical protein